jgi:hypothetical protein
MVPKFIDLSLSLSLYLSRPTVAKIKRGKGRRRCPSFLHNVSDRKKEQHISKFHVTSQ